MLLAERGRSDIGETTKDARPHTEMVEAIPALSVSLMFLIWLFVHSYMTGSL